MGLFVLGYFIYSKSSGIIISGNSMLPLSDVYVVGSWNSHGLEGDHCSALDVDKTGITGTYTLRRPSSWHLTTIRPVEVYAHKTGYMRESIIENDGERIIVSWLGRPVGVLKESTVDKDLRLKYLQKLLWASGCYGAGTDNNKLVPFLKTVLDDALSIVGQPTPYMLFDNPDLYKIVSNLCMGVAKAAVRKSRHPKTREFDAEAREYISAQLPACAPYFEEPRDRRADKSPLLTADRIKLENLLASGYMIDERFSNSKTSLNFAVLENNLEIARLLIEHGADPNAIGSGGTILQQVVADWHLSDTAKTGLVRFLIENGARFQEKESRYDSPFIMAIKKNKLNIVEFMIQAGADVNRRGSHDKGRRGKIALPLLHTAAVEMTELLLRHGADPNFAGLYGRTPLIHATVNIPDITGLLICSGARVNGVDDAGWTPLMYAVLLHKQNRNGNKEQALKRINFLLEHGADIHLKNDNGETAMDISSNGHVRGILLDSDNNSASRECN